MSRSFEYVVLCVFDKVYLCGLHISRMNCSVSSSYLNCDILKLDLRPGDLIVRNPVWLE